MIATLSLSSRLDFIMFYSMQCLYDQWNAIVKWIKLKIVKLNTTKIQEKFDYKNLRRNSEYYTLI